MLITYTKPQKSSGRAQELGFCKDGASSMGSPCKKNYGTLGVFEHAEHITKLVMYTLHVLIQSDLDGV